MSSMFFDVYTSGLSEALSKIDRASVSQAHRIILQYAQEQAPIYVFGNGGSASLSEHFSCDHTKGVRHDTELRSNIISLASNMALITAIANDYSYDEIFSKQIEAFPNNRGLAIAISASGSSKNVVKGLRTAGQKGLETMAFVGFDGGYIMDYEMADYVVHVPSDNYGIVEDSHQILMHSISQAIRSKFFLTKDENHKLRL
jgi:D-sedoheptulose 7-phosphate isomerase